MQDGPLDVSFSDLRETWEEGLVWWKAKLGKLPRALNEEQVGFNVKMDFMGFLGFLGIKLGTLDVSEALSELFGTL